MAKLTGAKKKAFLERMAKGQRKAKRGNPTRKTKPRTKPAKKAKRKAPKPAKKKASRKNPKLTGAKKAAFLKRMALGRKKAKRNGGSSAQKRTTSKKRRNSGEDEAAAMFETFHQKKPGHIVEYEELVRFPGNFAELGDLIELRVFLDDANRDFPFTRFGECKVVCTPDGSNIYFVGGDQAIDLEALELTTDKDTIELGPCTYICYFTVKGFHDFAPTKYWHRFGEEDGVFPRLGYDRLNKRLYLIGGAYQVKREGIVN
jgi:hypothetical protein